MLFCLLEYGSKEKVNLSCSLNPRIGEKMSKYIYTIKLKGLSRLKYAKKMLEEKGYTVNDIYNLVLEILSEESIDETLINTICRMIPYPVDVFIEKTVSEIDKHIPAGCFSFWKSIEEIATPDTAEALRKIKKKYRG